METLVDILIYHDEIVHTAMDVIIRGLNEELYRQLKAKAALHGHKISRALEDAIRIWVEAGNSVVQDEADANNKAYSTMKQDLLRRHPRKYVVFAEGKLLGVANTLEQAGKLARQHTRGRVLLTRLGKELPAGGEWLWSSIELASA